MICLLSAVVQQLTTIGEKDAHACRVYMYMYTHIHNTMYVIHYCTQTPMCFAGVLFVYTYVYIYVCTDSLVGYTIHSLNIERNENVMCFRDERGSTAPRPAGSPNSVER